jgi:hypothetical protein
MILYILSPYAAHSACLIDGAKLFVERIVRNFFGVGEMIYISGYEVFLSFLDNGVQPKYNNTKMSFLY